jgi:two-component system CheB/CheR fusion protein
MAADAYEHELAATTSVRQIGDIVRRAARHLAGADGATFVLRDGEFCFYADEDGIGPLWKGQRFPMGQCISGWAMQHRQSVSVPDVSRDARIPITAYRPTFVRSLVMVPVNREEPVAAIGAYWATCGVESQAPVAALESLADVTAAAIERVGLADAPWAPNFSLRGAGPLDRS